jgi:hypothetical protein
LKISFSLTNFLFKTDELDASFKKSNYLLKSIFISNKASFFLCKRSKYFKIVSNLLEAKHFSYTSFYTHETNHQFKVQVHLPH